MPEEHNTAPTGYLPTARLQNYCPEEAYREGFFAAHTSGGKDVAKNLLRAQYDA